MTGVVLFDAVMMCANFETVTQDCAKHGTKICGISVINYAPAPFAQNFAIIFSSPVMDDRPCADPGQAREIINSKLSAN